MKSLPEKIAVMQSYLDGADITVKLIGEGEGSPTESPEWDWGKFDYSVVEYRYVNIFGNETGVATYASRGGADEGCGKCRTRTGCVRVDIHRWDE